MADANPVSPYAFYQILPEYDFIEAQEAIDKKIWDAYEAILREEEQEYQRMIEEQQRASEETQRLLGLQQQTNSVPLNP